MTHNDALLSLLAELQLELVATRQQLDAANAERDGVAAKNAEMHEHIRVLEAERLPEEVAT